VIHFTSPAGWLPVHRDQLRAQRSVTNMGKLYLLPRLTLWSTLVCLCVCPREYLRNYIRPIFTKHAGHVTYTAVAFSSGAPKIVVLWEISPSDLQLWPSFSSSTLRAVGRVIGLGLILALAIHCLFQRGLRSYLCLCRPLVIHSGHQIGSW